MPGFAFPTVGPLGLGSPPYRTELTSRPSVLCSAKTAQLPFPDHFALRSFPGTLPAPFFVSHIRGSPARGSGASTPGLLVRRYPFSSGKSARRHRALPSSRVDPMNACPALRPRWCPARLPLRTQDCCLPPVGQRRLSLPGLWRVISMSTTIHFSGLNNAACILAPSGFKHPITGMHADFASDLPATLWSGGT